MSVFPPFLRNGVPFEELSDGWDLHEAVCQRMDASCVRRHVAGLPDPERWVLAARYGLAGVPLTRVEVATTIGMAPSTVGQIERRAIHMLRRTQAVVELQPRNLA